MSFLLYIPLVALSYITQPAGGAAVLHAQERNRPAHWGTVSSHCLPRLRAPLDFLGMRHAMPLAPENQLHTKYTKYLTSSQEISELLSIIFFTWTHTHTHTHTTKLRCNTSNKLFMRLVFMAVQ